MDLLIYIVFGGIVGWVASILMKTDAQQGILLNVIIGIVGSVLGNWIMGALGMGTASGLNLQSFVVALIGAVILIAVVRFFRR